MIVAVRNEPIRMALSQRSVDRYLAGCDIQHQPQARPPSQIGRQGDALFGRSAETQRRVEAVERGMDEDIAAAARLERRGEADMAEPHRRDPGEARRPGLERSRNQRMQMVHVDGNPLIVR